MASASELSSSSSGALESGTDTSAGNAHTVNLLDLATSCLAAAMAASEPIRRIALGSVSSQPRTPLVSAVDEGELASGAPSTLVVVEEGVQHQNESARSLVDFSCPSFTRNTPSRQSSMASIASRSKADGTLVTDADGAAQRLIVHAIRSVDKHVTIVGEESAEEENRLSGDLDHPPDQNGESTSALETLADQAILASTPPSTSPSVPPAPSGQLLPVHQWDSCWRFAQEEIQRRTPESLADIEVEVDASRVSVFVDPLDGTKNYARGQFDAVTILVAIILDNTPCFGVICKPFGQDTSSAEGSSDADGDVVAAAAALASVSLSEAAEGAAPSVPPMSPSLSAAAAFKKVASTPNCSYAVFGGTLIQGVFVTGQDDAVSPSFSSRSSVPQPGNTSTADDNHADNPLPRAIISSSRSGGIVKRICVALHEEGVLNPEMVLVSGAGEKALRLVVGTQHEGLWPFPRPGTSLWDVAAADALLLQQGGRLTDSMGRPMNYAAAAFEEGTTDNDSGIFASSSAELHQTCVKVFQVMQEQDANEGPPAP